MDGQDVLARLAGVPITTWNYSAQDAAIVHMGPTAQDFYAAFGLGEDDRHIAALDANGVALAAVQELTTRDLDQQAQIETLSRQLSDLETRLTALESTAAAGGYAPQRAGAPVESGRWAFGVGTLLVGLVLGWDARHRWARRQAEVTVRPVLGTR